MALDGRSLLVLIHRLAAIDARARSRLARLMAIGRMEASAVLALAGGGHLTAADLQAELDLSPGGARALVGRLEREALVVREPDPGDPFGVRLRLSQGARLELAAALHHLIGRLDAVAAQIEDPLDELVRAVDSLGRHWAFNLPDRMLSISRPRRSRSPDQVPYNFPGRS
jgi:DNA-binding MarR family transcriptional regulator